MFNIELNIFPSPSLLNLFIYWKIKSQYVDNFAIPKLTTNATVKAVVAIK